jgi:hypothetical protein
MELRLRPSGEAKATPSISRRASSALIAPVTSPVNFVVWTPIFGTVPIGVDPFDLLGGADNATPIRPRDVGASSDDLPAVARKRDEDRGEDTDAP